MRLRRFEVKNFKGIEHVTVEWDDLLVLIGENNAGKSSLLHALSCFLSGSAIKEVSLFRRHETGPDDAIELIGHFDQLTPVEFEQVAVKGRTCNGEWILKKRYWFEADAAGDDDKGGWKERLFSYSCHDTFANWPAVDNAWNIFPAEYQPLIQQLPGNPLRPNIANRGQLRELVRQQRSDLVVQGRLNGYLIPVAGEIGNRMPIHSFHEPYMYARFTKQRKKPLPRMPPHTASSSTS